MSAPLLHRDPGHAPGDAGGHGHDHAHGGSRRSSRTPLLVVGGLVALLLVVVRLASPALGPGLLPDTAQDFVTLTISVIVESMPFVLLGIVLSIVVQVWLPQAFFTSWLPRQPLLRRAVISFLGMFLPVCECGNVPLARGLVLKGFTVSESMTFLLAAPMKSAGIIVDISRRKSSTRSRTRPPACAWSVGSAHSAANDFVSRLSGSGWRL